jgi:hypothetical protein
MSTATSSAAEAAVPGLQAVTHAFMTVEQTDGRTVILSEGQIRLDAVLAEQVLTVTPGQRVAVMVAPGAGDLSLVVATFPQPQNPGPQIGYDAATETLTLSARHLHLQAEDGLHLLNAGASLALKPDGSSELRAERIVASAIETHRIEGGAIELN